ncbi:PTS sugar transporter subunit IIA [Enterococcus canintestini]|uniref:Ascorbate-specific PTS system EIIA component n=1 Tax=Enterococcus canintestini TaxID=317010 RepID=A0A267HT41_9ENTE|nr:PTS sugar transporter subunit IIA [Enterococcus canintestini]PAB01529.1 transcriptional antiterminator [Enterococcus canintestini]
MNERIRKILSLLIRNPELKMNDLTTKLNLTKRQINYAINSFNSELKLKNIPQIQRSHSGDFEIPLAVIQMLTTEENKQSFYNIADGLSDSDRADLILMLLITDTGYVGLDHFMDLLDVSKSTLVEDVKKAEWLASKYELDLIYDRVNGYSLKGSEHRLLQLMSDMVHQHPIFQENKVRDLLASNISEEEVIHLIHGMEQMLHLSYSDESVDYLQSAARFLISRGLREKSNTDFLQERVSQTPEYKLLQILVSETKWQLSPKYLEWLTLLFLTSNIFEKKTTQDFDSDLQLRHLIHQMVDVFQNQTLILVEDRENFERRILNHLRPACFRIRYNLSLGVYSLENLIQDSNHGILVELMKELIIPIEKWLGKAFPEDELNLLSYYFGFQLTSHDQQQKQKPRAVVVCTNGVMVSKLMRESLKQLFPEVHFLASFSVRDFYHFEEDYDLVFTTTPLKTNLVQFIVDPIMSYKEQISLRYRVLGELGIDQMDQTVDELVTIIQQHAKVNNLRNLKEDLQYFLLQASNNTSLENHKVLPALTYYLKPHFIQHINEKVTWQKAVKIACQPLLESRIIDETFYEDCIRQISDLDYAGYLGSQTCIPHTTTEHGVLRDGVSLLISQQPIDFPGGHQVSLIMPLSFYDLTRHLRAINQIAAISENDELIQNLKESDEITSYQLIRQYT